MSNSEDEIPDALPFYDSTGAALFYLYDGQYFYLFDGTPIGWLLDQEHVYSYSGRWLGWWQNGWLWGRDGKAAFFSELASGGPSRPSRQSRPSRSSRQSRPSRSSRESRPSRPARISEWGLNTVQSFFE